jgi:hypothetical protein
MLSGRSFRKPFPGAVARTTGILVLHLKSTDHLSTLALKRQELHNFVRQISETSILCSNNHKRISKNQSTNNNNKENYIMQQKFANTDNNSSRYKRISNLQGTQNNQERNKKITKKKKTKKPLLQKRK